MLEVILVCIIGAFYSLHLFIHLELLIFFQNAGIILIVIKRLIQDSVSPFVIMLHVFLIIILHITYLSSPQILKHFVSPTKTEEKCYSPIGALSLLGFLAHHEKLSIIPPSRLTGLPKKERQRQRENV